MLTSTPPGAQVFGVDGLRLGTTPLEITLHQRARVVTLRLEGHKRLRQRLRLDGPSQVEVKLEPTRSAPPRRRRPAPAVPEGVGDLLEYGQ